jgi:hypothetical protein
MSMKIGKPGVQGHGQGRTGLRQLRLRHRRTPHPAGHERKGATGKKEKQHPLTLLRIAYGLD